GSEDFAFMLLERPGAFIIMGTNNGTEAKMLHSPDYDFNDSVPSLKIGHLFEIACELHN
ncbi:unnamed protein product, partial [Rotaria sp. Silwood1]